MNSKQFLYIIIATFITVLLWVVSDILHTQSQVQIPPQTQELMKEISPSFDLETLKEF